MNTIQDQRWAEEEQMGNMAAQDLDFSNLLDLGDMDVHGFSLPDASANDQQPQYAVQPLEQHYPSDGLVDLGSSAVQDFANNTWDMQMDMDTNTGMHSLESSQVASPSFNHNFDPHSWSNAVQTQQQQQHGNMVFHQPQPIPPTPNSYELHGGDPLRMDSAKIAHQRQAMVNNQMHQLNLNQAKRDNFTPLVSPAVTPQESVFQPTHEYTVPGAYFSPLSSPAIQAQHAAQQVQHFSLGHPNSQASTNNHSTATSPISGDLDMTNFGADSAVLMPERGKRNTRKTGAQRTMAQRAALRQSPLVKAQKRKSAALSNALSTQDLNTLLLEAQAAQSQNVGASSTEPSTGGSISPEPLTEALMGPPPRPGHTSAHQSPTLYGQMPAHQQLRMKTSGGPATPTSLMSIDGTSRPGSSTPHAASGHTHPLANVDSLDDFALPPAAENSNVPAVPTAELVKSTPIMSAPHMTPNMAPNGARSGSVLISPAINGMASPSVAMTPSTKARGSKKRASMVGSAPLISPAIRPKISPSIKPLLPEGSSLTDSQHAFLLASKSNYTHLLEGTSLPGVSYPDSLSSGLTSKRTSHKIAEQGRRNRINEALKEMQALLPSPALRGKSKSDKMDIEGAADADDDADEDAKGKKASAAAAEAKAANSKAATVESAIDYIRTLQEEQRAMEERLRSKDEEMDALREKLREMETKLGSETAAANVKA